MNQGMGLLLGRAHRSLETAILLGEVEAFLPVASRSPGRVHCILLRHCGARVHRTPPILWALLLRRRRPRLHSSCCRISTWCCHRLSSSDPLFVCSDAGSRPLNRTFGPLSAPFQTPVKFSRSPLHAQLTALQTVSLTLTKAQTPRPYLHSATPRNEYFTRKRLKKTQVGGFACLAREDASEPSGTSKLKVPTHHIVRIQTVLLLH